MGLGVEGNGMDLKRSLKRKWLNWRELCVRLDGF
jgi:hypothetical protein